MSWPSTVRSRTTRGTSLFALLASFGNHDPGYGDDQQEQEQQNNRYDNDDDPHRKTGFLTSLSLGLLAALNQSIDFRVLREQSLDFFKLRNCRRVILLPVIIQSFTKRRVGW